MISKKYMDFRSNFAAISPNHHRISVDNTN